MLPIDIGLRNEIVRDFDADAKALQPVMGTIRSPNSVFASTYERDEFRLQGRAWLHAVEIGGIHLSRTGFSEPLARAETSAYTRIGRKMHADPPVRVGRRRHCSIGDETLQGEPRRREIQRFYGFLIEFSEYESATTQRGILRRILRSRGG